MNHRPDKSSRSRGVTLVAVMWVVLVSGVMLLGVVKAARTQRALSHGGFQALEAHWLARAGVEQAMAVLEDDDPTADSTLDKWFDDPTVFEDIELGSGSFSVVSAAEDHRP